MKFFVFVIWNTRAECLLIHPSTAPIQDKHTVNTHLHTHAQSFYSPLVRSCIKANKWHAVFFRVSLSFFMCGCVKWHAISLKLTLSLACVRSHLPAARISHKIPNSGGLCLPKHRARKARETHTHTHVRADTDAMIFTWALCEKREGEMTKRGKLSHWWSHTADIGTSWRLYMHVSIAWQTGGEKKSKILAKQTKGREYLQKCLSAKQWNRRRTWLQASGHLNLRSGWGAPCTWRKPQLKLKKNKIK